MGALGAKVTVSAQSYEDLAWAAAYGYETDRLEDLAWELGGFDLVVNTIPAPVLDERRLRWVAPGAFLLDLASAPGGIDRAAAQRRNLQVLQAPGLPGRGGPGDGGGCHPGRRVSYFMGTGGITPWRRHGWGLPSPDRSVP